jgi:broad specificity phosphatase PhoE
MNLVPTKVEPTLSPIVHLVRHGRIPDYMTDRPLTVEGEQDSLAVGRELASHIRSEEQVSFFSSPSLRARQTAALIRDGILEALSEGTVAATVAAPILIDDRLKNNLIFVGGVDYDPIEPLLDMARWQLHENPTAQNEACAAYVAGFWGTSDPVAYWLTRPSEFAESPAVVVERTQACLADHLADSLNDACPRRAICVTHSANLRSFLSTVFGADPGPPLFSSMLTITDDRVYYQGQVGVWPSW